MSNWTCSCGQVNSGNFCIGCGKVRPKLNIASGLQPTLPPEPSPEQTAQPVIPEKPSTSPTNHTASEPRTSVNAAATQKMAGLMANKKLIFCVVGGILLVAMFAMFRGKDKNSTEPMAERQNTTVSTQAKTQTGPVGSSDLEMGGICIGYSQNKVFKILGKAPSTTYPDVIGITYIYPDMEVNIADGKVHSIVSSTGKAMTKRGIHQGNTYSEVVKAYGADFSSFKYGKMTMYEYKTKSVDNKDCILRFAILNDRVDYISMRVLEEERALKDPVLASIVPSRFKHFEKQIMTTGERFLDFHQAISNREYDKAYDFYTPDGQKKYGSRGNFSKGYENTLSSKVVKLKTTLANDSKVIFDYQVETRNRDANRIKVQTYAGTVAFYNSSSGWKMAYTVSDVIDSRYE